MTESGDAHRTAPVPPAGALEIHVVSSADRLRAAVRTWVDERLPVTAILRWTVAPLAEPTSAARPLSFPRRLEIPRGRGVRLYLPVERIDWIEAANQYARVHAGGHRYVVRRSLSELEASLDPSHFSRVHRSAIVNLERVHELHAVSPAERWVLLAGGQRIAVSEGRLEALRAALTASA